MFPQNASQPLGARGQWPPASPLCAREAGAALPAKGALEVLVLVTRWLVAHVSRRGTSALHRRGRSWGSAARLRLVPCGLPQAAQRLPRFPRLPRLPSPQSDGFGFDRLLFGISASDLCSAGSNVTLLRD